MTPTPRRSVRRSTPQPARQGSATKFKSASCWGRTRCRQSQFAFPRSLHSPLVYCRTPRLTLASLPYRAFDNFFLQAQRVRKLLQLEFADAFRCPSPLAAESVGAKLGADGVDVLVHPSAINTAPLLGASATSKTAGYVQDVLNVGASLAGLPAVSVPAGRAEDGWPVGVQVVGQWGMDELVLDVGRALEES